MLTQSKSPLLPELQSAVVKHPLVVSAKSTVIEAISAMSGVRSHCSSSSMADGQLESLYIEARSSCVLVLENDQIIGILTERDVVRLTARQSPLHQLRVEQVMANPVVTLNQSAFTHIFVANNILQQHHIRHLPIVDDENRLLGLVTHESLRRSSQMLDLLRLRQVAEVMTHQVICTSPQSSVLATAQLMAKHQVGSVVLVKPHSNSTEDPQIPVGILTERDLVQFQALQLNLETCTAEEVMSTPIFAVSQEESLLTVQEIMEQHFIRRLVVTGKQGQLLGIVTQSSVLQAINPIEIYNLAEFLGNKVMRLEAEKVALLESRTAELEQEVETRTVALKVKAEREKLLADLATQIRSSLSLQTILNTTVTQVRQLLGCDRVNIWQFQANLETQVVAESTDSPVSLMGRRIDDTCFKEKQVEVYRQGHIRVVSDIHTTKMSDCHRQMLMDLQTRAKVLVPLLCGENLWGLLNVTESQHSRDWQPEEVELLQRLSVQLGIALQQAITHQQLQDELNERRQAEVRLQESEIRYRGMFNQAAVGFVNASIGGEILDVNPWFCSMLGCSRDRLLGTSVREITHPDDREQILPELLRLCTDEIPYFTQEKRYLRKDGNYFWSSTCVSLVKDATGHPSHTLAVVQDITHRKQAEMALQNLIAGTATTTGQDFFPALVSHIATALNVSYAIVTERVDDTLQSLAFWANGSLQPSIKYKYAKTPCEQSLEHGTFYCSGAIQQRFPDDIDLVEMEAESYLGMALLDNQGQKIGSLCILDHQTIQNPEWAEQILHVFAARAAAELERQRATLLLEQLNQGLETTIKERTKALDITQSAVDLAAEGVFLVRADSSFYYLNGAACSLLGYSREELMTLTVSDIDLNVPSEGWLDFFKEIKRQKTLSIETQVLTKQNQILPVEVGLNYLEFYGESYILAFLRDITLRKQNEQAMKQQLAAIEAAADGIAVLQGDTYLYLNRAHLKLFGYEYLEELIGEPWGRMYSLEEVERFEQEIFPLLREERAWQGEAIATRKNGSTFAQGLSLTLTDEGLLICVCHDISERKRAEIALQTKTEELDRFFSLALDLLSITNTDGYFLRLNSQWEKTLGYPLSEIEGTRLIEYVHPDDVDRTLKAFSKVKQGENIFNFVSRYRCWDGSYRWIEWRAAAPNDNLIYSAARDITDRKQSEDNLRQLTMRLNLAVKSSGIGIWDWNIPQNHLVWDKQMYALYGINPDDFASAHDAWMSSVHPDDRRAANLISEQAKGGEKEYDTQFRVVRPDGSIRYIQANALVQRNFQGDPQRMIGINYDITTYKQAEAQLQQSNEELIRATRLKDEFLANMSHELRTPLNAILGMTEGLQEEVFGNINKQQLKALQTIERSSNHLLSLINDILDVAKIESGQIKLDLTTTAIAPLCRSSLTFIKQQAQKKRIQLQTELPANLPDLLIDERRIRQVLINLLNNAVKFTPESGQITLTVSLQQQISNSNPDSSLPPSYLRIAILDTGIGIAPEHLNKLFQPFIQIDSALNRQYQGTGLGLALVKRIVELHGGQVGVTSTVGVGSCFSLDLPCTEIRSSFAEPKFQPQAKISPAGNGPDNGSEPLKSPLILLAEDNEANINTISSYLRAKRYRLIFAKNGHQAVSLAQSEAPDLILMDIQMPEMDGLEAMQHIRLDPQSEDVPIIALTALAMKGDRERCIQAGATDYLSKPVKLKQLAATIQQHLALSSN